MTTPAERPKSRPSPCPRCGTLNGWKRISCINPACATRLRSPKAERAPKPQTPSRVRQWITRLKAAIGGDR